MTDVLVLDEALEQLTKVDRRQAGIVELNYSGGLTIEETGAVLDIAPATVKREWRNGEGLDAHSARASVNA